MLRRFRFISNEPIKSSLMLMRCSQVPFTPLEVLHHRFLHWLYWSFTDCTIPSLTVLFLHWLYCSFYHHGLCTIVTFLLLCFQSQFVLFVFHTGYNLTLKNCAFPWGYMLAVFLYAISLIVLFGNFYYRTYTNKAATKRSWS